MGKITLINKNNQIIISNRLTLPETINQREASIVSRGIVDGVIPVSVVAKKKTIEIQCVVQGRLSLKSFFQGVINRKLFLNIVLQIINLLKTCEDCMLDVDNLVLDYDYIFIDPRTKKLWFIYWPVDNNQFEYELADFLRNLPFRVIFDSHEDNTYVNEYIQYFVKNEPFSLNIFEKFISQLAGIARDDVTPHAPSGSTADRVLDNRSKQESTEGIANNTIYYPPIISADKKSIFSEPIVSERINEKVIPQNSKETTVLGHDDSQEGTTVLGVDNWDEPSFPYLIRVKTQEKISIDKPVFRIGKEKRYCDYFVADNSAVSRSHADIITRQNRYFIYDNNSTNGTYVDDKAIPVHKEIEIFSGSRIRLANEEFIFYI